MEKYRYKILDNLVKLSDNKIWISDKEADEIINKIQRKKDDWAVWFIISIQPDGDWYKLDHIFPVWKWQDSADLLHRTLQYIDKWKKYIPLINKIKTVMVGEFFIHLFILNYETI